MSDKVIGDASEFYRLRVVRLDEGDEPDLEWRDDILWRRPPIHPVDEYEVWRVQVVGAASDEAVASLADFTDPDEAHEWVGSVQEDLESMTKSEFDERYVTGRE